MDSNNKVVSTVTETGPPETYIGQRVLCHVGKKREKTNPQWPKTYGSSRVFFILARLSMAILGS